MRATIGGLLLIATAQAEIPADVNVNPYTDPHGDTTQVRTRRTCRAQHGALALICRCILFALQECYAWAADGACTGNPGHMLTQCKYSCWEWFKFRREKYTDAPIDKYMDCNSWANQGECGKSARAPPPYLSTQVANPREP